MAMNKVKHRSTVFTNSWLRQREIGQRPALGSTNKLMKGLYTSILPSTSWDHKDSLHCAIPGGVFNLEFSPDGSLLVAACEKRSILMFDPLSRQLIHAVDNAHNDCVNCVRFLDSRVFATCSDDSTVALWDARNLRSRIRTLQGHSNWVKNIEFSQSDGLLVTSGFDGSIYTWDINSYTETGFLYNRVFHTNGLMRTRLNPDASKMIICTTGGYLILIHNLDLKTLKDDLEGFKPNMYRLMQLSQTTIPVAANYTHLFSSKRKTNRIEFITDFPEKDDAEVVSSLQVHPHGWCVLSRNISNDESSEWTCVHDIQEQACHSDDSDVGVPSESEDDENVNDGQDMVFIGSDARARIIPTFRRHAVNDPSMLSPYSRRIRTLSAQQSAPFRGFPSAIPTVSRIVEGRRELTVSSADVWEALVAIREARSRRERDRMEAERRRAGAIVNQGNNEPETRLRIVRMASGLNQLPREARRSRDSSSSSRSEEEDDRTRQRGGYHSVVVEPPSVTSIVIRYRRNPQEQQAINFESFREDQDPEMNGRRALLVVEGRERNLRIVQTRPTVNRLRIPRNHRIHLNSPRLTHFIEEPNVGKGFIKELCFSSDGRLICSPFGYGVRLLAFSSECSELSTCVPKSTPMALHELGTNVCHADIVVSTKFSPRHCLFVSGCLTGRIVWHQPVV